MRLVTRTKRRVANRSEAIEIAVAESVKRQSRARLARECAKLNPAVESAMAEEALVESLEAWPDY